ncbi:LmeA family phospholipid-binding protein [Streptomyces sp. NPDC004393]|uniref:LmeA family phospholipid-binding protein n=1 Tax=Streptomyces sp. NPDC004533 TaxID=3154278 RepID=UPI0033BDE3F2
MSRPPTPTTAMRSLLRRHRTVTALALALLLTAAGAELTARTLLHARLATVAGRVLGKGSDIRVEGGPALLDLWERHLDAVTVRSEHARLGRIPDVAVRARLDDIRLTGGQAGTVARTHAEVAVPAASLQALAAPSGTRIPVTGVRPDPGAGTITLDLGQSGLAQVTLRPRLKDGRVTLAVDSAEVLGGPAPVALVDRIRDTLSDRSGTDYPLGLKATALDVTASGLDVTLAGGHARLPARNNTL